MFEKITKKFATKATDSALEGVSQSLNEKIGPHIDMIQILLVFGVVALGTHIVKQKPARNDRGSGYIPAYLPPAGSGQPIIVNNYYRERGEEAYGQYNRKQQQCYLRNGQVQVQTQKGKTYPKR